MGSRRDVQKPYAFLPRLSEARRELMSVGNSKTHGCTQVLLDVLETF